MENELLSHRNISRLAGYVVMVMSATAIVFFFADWYMVDWTEWLPAVIGLTVFVVLFIIGCCFLNKAIEEASK